MLNHYLVNLVNIILIRPAKLVITYKDIILYYTMLQAVLKLIPHLYWITRQIIYNYNNIIGDLID